MGDDEAKQASPTIDAIHVDVEYATKFRLERIKTSLAIAAALLAFTVTFRPQLQVVSDNGMLLVTWIALGLSVVGGLGDLYGWERFYINYRDHDWRGRKVDGKKARASITRWRRLSMLAQMLGLIVGVLLLAIFSWINLPNAIHKS